jgi:uncharacterized membrane protein YebE (DUF533 family)
LYPNIIFFIDLTNTKKIMKTKMYGTLLFVVILAATNASAQTIGQHERNQQRRIREGVKSGKLTRAEARNVRHDQKEIREDIREAKHDDGKIDASERKEIKQEQRRASREIYRKKHNARERY